MRVLHQKLVKSRKTYKCKICNKDINIGETYKNTKLISEDNKLETSHMHDFCFQGIMWDCKTCELIYIDGSCSNECEEHTVW